MRRLLLSSVACTALATAAPAQQSQVLVPTGPYVNLLSSSLKLYSLADYCAGACTTTAQQTAAFVTVAGLINGAGGRGTMWIPPGAWAFDTTLAGGVMVFPNAGSSIIGPGAGSATVTVTGGSFAKWTAGHARISGFRLYEADNPASGVQVSLSGANSMDISDLQIGGGCTSFELASAVEVHATNLTIIGDNSNGSCAPTSVATGPVGMLVHRSSSGAINPSENTFTNLMIRGNSGRTIKNSIVLSNSDGIVLIGGHIGFSSAEALLIQPEYADDKIDNIRAIGLDYDTNSYGVRFAPYSGTFTGIVVDNTFSSAMAELSDNDGIRIDDPAAARIAFVGMNTLLNGHSGINIQGGSNITITGGSFAKNNGANGSYPNLLIGLATSHVSVSGGVYLAGGSFAPPYHVVVADTADYVAIGSASYMGASTGNISNTSSGTHNAAPVMSSTDKATTEWPNITTVTSSGNTWLNALNGAHVAQIYTAGGSSSNSDYLVFKSTGGGGPTIVADGADGVNTTLLVSAGASALTTLGNAAAGIASPGPAVISGATTLAAVSMTSRTLTSLAESTTGPTIASGFCTSPLIGARTNGTLAFQFTIGTGCAAGGGTLTMPAATNGWKCNFSDITNPAANRPDTTGTTSTSVSVQNYSRTTGAPLNWTASDLILADCHGF